MIVAKIRELVEDDRVACPGFRFSAFLKHRERFIATVQAINKNKKKKKTVVLSAIFEYNDIGYLDLDDPLSVLKRKEIFK